MIQTIQTSKNLHRYKSMRVFDSHRLISMWVFDLHRLDSTRIYSPQNENLGEYSPRNENLAEYSPQIASKRNILYSIMLNKKAVNWPSGGYDGGYGGFAGGRYEAIDERKGAYSQTSYAKVQNLTELSCLIWPKFYRIWSIFGQTRTYDWI